MKDKKSTLIVSMDKYPFGKGEEFFETEINYLQKNFHNIIIISNNTKDKLTRKVPDNIKILRYDNEKSLMDKIKVIKYFFYKNFWQEIKTIKEVYSMKISFSMLPLILGIMFNSERYLKYLLGFIKEYNIDVSDDLYLYSYWCGFNTVSFIDYKKLNPKAVCISRAHGYDLYFEANSANYIAFRKYIADGIDKIFFISSNGKEYFSDKVNVHNDNKFKVARLGINNPLKPAKASKDGVLRIVSCSFVAPVKRLDLIIESLSKITEVSIEWTHIGDGDLIAKTKELAKTLLSDKRNIKYEFKGYLTNKEIYSFYEDREIDCFINLSSSEGIPVSMMEALSFSIPIIATKVGGVPEIVNESNGFLLSSHPTVEEVVECIHKFKSLKEDEIINIRKNAFYTWESKYKAEKNYMDFIEEIKNSNIKL